MEKSQLTPSTRMNKKSTGLLLSVLPQVAWAEKNKLRTMIDPSSVCRSDHSCCTPTSARMGESDRYCPIF